jgi:hypothetical protein
LATSEVVHRPKSFAALLEPKMQPSRPTASSRPKPAECGELSQLAHPGTPGRTLLLRGGVLLLAIVPLALGACTGSTASSAASATPKPASTSTPAPTATPLLSPDATIQASPSAAVTQTEIAWGRIWDEIPASFPRYAGSEPTTVTGEPASATLSVPGSAADVTTWMKDELEKAGYSIEALTGPLEDGSRSISATGSTNPDCRVQVTVKPLGSTTVETVYFGAACTFS